MTLQLESKAPMPLSLAEARALYDGGAPVTAVAAALEIDARAFLRLRKTYNWPLRPSPIATGAKPAHGDKRPRLARTKSAKRKRASGKTAPPPASAPSETAPADLAPVNIPAVRRQVETAVQANLASVQNTLASGDTADIERNARLLASLVKSLAELRRLEALEPRSDDNTGAADGNEDERPPRDIETLRDELARALERMSVERAGQAPGG